MSANGAVLTRLCRIVEEAGSSEERAAHALALWNAYKTKLYVQHDIGRSSRPTARAKAQADRALADLRREVRNAELAAPEARACIFTMVRYRIEMARRALAIRIADGENLAIGCAKLRADRPVESRVPLVDATLMRAGRPAPMFARQPDGSADRSAPLPHGVFGRGTGYEGRHDDWRKIEAVRERLRNHVRISRSWDAINQSRKLLIRLSDPTVR